MAQARVNDGERRPQGGFTLIEVLVAVTISMVGLAGVLGLERVGSRATGYSRHATEATVLAEDKLERLRTTPIVDLFGGTELVAASGAVGAGPYTRLWQVAWTGDLADISVTVSWFEHGSDSHAVTFRTRRNR